MHLRHKELRKGYVVCGLDFFYFEANAIGKMPTVTILNEVANMYRQKKESI